MPLSENMLKAYNDAFEEIDIENNWVRFYNHGYATDKELIEYDSLDLAFKNRANLYAYLLEEFKTDTENKTILDIGCGLGRGCNLLKKYYNFKKITGVDINTNHIQFAKNNFKGIDFKRMDAENLNFEEQFDIVISVEALCYFFNSVDFYKGLHGVLKSGGIARITSLFPTNSLSSIENSFKESGLEIVEARDLTAGVIRSCEENSQNLIDLFPDVKKEWILSVQNRLDNFASLYRSNFSAYYAFDLKKL